jgi:hypothetical protein
LQGARAITSKLRSELVSHLAALRSLNVTFEPPSLKGVQPAAHVEHGGHDAPEPFVFHGRLASGSLEIVDTPDGERMRLVLLNQVPGVRATVLIARGAQTEVLRLEPQPDAKVMQSRVAPAEPHEFEAVLQLKLGDEIEDLSLQMSEPEGHHH